MSLTIYHNPRCSKSRKTLEIIQSSGVTPTIVEYLDETPPAAEILRLAQLIGVPVKDLVRTGESEWQTAGDRPGLDDDQALAAWIERHPRVLQRPIVVDDETARAVVGRPPENVAALLP